MCHISLKKTRCFRRLKAQPTCFALVILERCLHNDLAYMYVLFNAVGCILGADMFFSYIYIYIYRERDMLYIKENNLNGYVRYFLMGSSEISIDMIVVLNK